MLEAIFSDAIETVTLSGLTQWDKGRTLTIKGLTLPTGTQVHFGNSNNGDAYIQQSRTTTGGIIADIPNHLLEENKDVKAWVYTINGTQQKTVKTVYIRVNGRAKPVDYVPDKPPSGGGGDNTGGTTDYNALSNLPSINGVKLTGNKTLSELNIQPKIAEDKGTEVEIPKPVVVPKVVAQQEVEAPNILNKTGNTPNKNVSTNSKGEIVFTDMPESGGGGTGQDGVGIESIEQTTTSNADGGTNVITVTLTNGERFTFNVKNGSKGSSGKTPVRGTDYWTTSDKTEMQNYCKSYIDTELLGGAS